MKIESAESSAASSKLSVMSCLCFKDLLFGSFACEYDSQYKVCNT